MARNFNGSSQYLRYSGTVISSNPITISAWFLPGSFSVTKTICCLGNTSNNDALRFLRVRGDLAGKPISVQTGEGLQVVSTTGTVTGWNHALGVFASNAYRWVMLNGGGVASDSTSLAAATPTVFFVGVHNSYTSLYDYFLGAIAEVAIWNVALSENEGIALSRGVSPCLVRPDNLIAYWHLVGRASPETDAVGGYNLTLYGSPTTADHPPMFYGARTVNSYPKAHSLGSVIIPVNVSDAGTADDGIPETDVTAYDCGVGGENISSTGEIVVGDTASPTEATSVLKGSITDHETRHHPQTAKMYMAIKRPRVVYKGTIAYNRGYYTNGVPDTDYRIHISSGGSLPGFDVADFMPHLTAWISSSSTEALWDHGKCRVRSISENDIYVSADLSCNWKAGDTIYITDVHELWPRPHTVIENGNTVTVYKDHDIPASERHEYPIPVLGPPACVFIDEETKTATVRFEGRRSYLIQPDWRTYEQMGWENYGITSWSWWFEGGTPETSTDPSPTVTYSTPGQYVVRCTVTAVNSYSFTGFRNVFIFEREGENAPITEFNITRMSGDVSRKGWETEIELFGSTVDTSVLPEGAQTVLFAEESFAGVPKQSTYGFPYRENIKMVGYLGETKIKVTANSTTVTASIRGLQKLMEEAANFAVYWTQADPNAPAWSYFPTGIGLGYGEGYGLTAMQCWYHTLLWHWTLLYFADVYLPSFAHDNNGVPGQNFPEGSLASQLDAFAKDHRCRWGVSREGALHIYPWVNTQALAHRYTYHPTILSITEDDIDGEAGIEINPRVGKRVARVRVEGIMANGTGWSDPVVATVPGDIKQYCGDTLVISNLLLGTDEQAREFAMMTLGEESRAIENVQMKMCGNFTLTDIAPVSRVLLTLQSVRGINWVEKSFWVIEQEDTYDATTGVLTTEHLTLLPETWPVGTAVSQWGAELWKDSYKQSPSAGGSYAITETIKKIAAPVTKIVPATMGVGGNLSGPDSGTTYVKLYDDPSQMVLAENRELKEISGRPVWVQVTTVGSEPTYKVIGLRNPIYSADPYMTDGRGYITRVATLTIPGTLCVYEEPPEGELPLSGSYSDKLPVAGSTVYARRLYAVLRTPSEGGSVTVAVMNGGARVGAITLGEGSIAATADLPEEVPMYDEDLLWLMVLSVGEDNPGSYLSVCVECREYGL